MEVKMIKKHVLKNSITKFEYGVLVRKLCYENDNLIKNFHINKTDNFDENKSLFIKLSEKIRKQNHFLFKKMNDFIFTNFEKKLYRAIHCNETIRYSDFLDVGYQEGFIK